MERTLGLFLEMADFLLGSQWLSSPLLSLSERRHESMAGWAQRVAAALLMRINHPSIEEARGSVGERTSIRLLLPTEIN